VSARLDGRARGGMADCLKAWLAAEAAGQPQLVEDAATVLARLTRRHRKRALPASATGRGSIPPPSGRPIWLPVNTPTPRSTNVKRSGSKPPSDR
jgi:hypothetical protein